MEPGQTQQSQSVADFEPDAAVEVTPCHGFEFEEVQDTPCHGFEEV